MIETVYFGEVEGFNVYVVYKDGEIIGYNYSPIENSIEI